MDTNAERIARMEAQITSNKESLDALWEAHKKCVTMERFRIVEMIALGLAALVLVPVVSQIISRVLLP